MACSCIEVMDAKLGEHNTKLSLTFSFPRDGSEIMAYPTISTEKLVPRTRKGPMLAIPTYCPFCGVRYVPTDPQPEVQAGAPPAGWREAIEDIRNGLDSGAPPEARYERTTVGPFLDAVIDRLADLEADPQPGPQARAAR